MDQSDTGSAAMFSQGVRTDRHRQSGRLDDGVHSVLHIHDLPVRDDHQDGVLLHPSLFETDR
eukprot:6585099-Pyramimonas_sp.AAC.2